MNSNRIYQYICAIVAVFCCCYGMMVDFGVVTEYMTLKDLTALSLINCGLFFGLFGLNFIKKGETDGEDQEQD